MPATIISILSSPNLTLLPAATTTITRSITAREYFSPVIDSRTLRRLAETAPLVIVDHNGERMDRERLPDDLPIPGLLVSPVNEAIKQVEAGRLIADLDRDSLWAVGGFVLDISVLDTLGEGTHSAAELIDAVTSAGFDWQPTIL
jgi:hypothetical protein